MVSLARSLLFLETKGFWEAFPFLLSLWALAFGPVAKRVGEGGECRFLLNLKAWSGRNASVGARALTEVVSVPRVLAGER